MGVDGVVGHQAVGQGQVGGAVGQRAAHHGGAGQDQPAGKDIVGPDGVQRGGRAETGHQQRRVHGRLARQHAHHARPAVGAQLVGIAIAVAQPHGQGLGPQPPDVATARAQRGGNGFAAGKPGDVHAQRPLRAPGQGGQPAAQRVQVEIVEGDGGGLARRLRRVRVKPADFEAAVAGVDEDNHAWGRIEISPTETGRIPSAACTSKRPWSSTPLAAPV
ncbi:Uncharacterised protein [Bordetella pertussis]|nr:Uncharacterised protein [Bordetella pertussis]